jgi:hypothetical protein
MVTDSSVLDGTPRAWRAIAVIDIVESVRLIDAQHAVQCGFACRPVQKVRRSSWCVSLGKQMVTVFA